MKRFSIFWKGSKKPKKQRKYRYNAPLHIKRKMISVALSKGLKKQYHKRNLPLRKEDKVKILRGDYKGKEGKVKEIDLKKLKVRINGVERTKRDGTKVYPLVDPSNLMIVELYLEDKLRQKFVDKIKEKKNVKETS